MLERTVSKALPAIWTICGPELVEQFIMQSKKLRAFFARNLGKIAIFTSSLNKCVLLYNKRNASVCIVPCNRLRCLRCMGGMWDLYRRGMYRWKRMGYYGRRKIMFHGLTASRWQQLHYTLLGVVYSFKHWKYRSPSSQGESFQLHLQSWDLVNSRVHFSLTLDICGILKEGIDPIKHIFSSFTPPFNSVR